MEKQARRQRCYNPIQWFLTASLLLPLILTPLFLASPATGSDSLEQSFVAPPNSAKPWVFWFWMNGNITKQGITADLEAMHDAGIGGMTMMHVGAGIPAGPVQFFSDEWRDLFRFATEEADRLGIKISMNACDGWTGTGGPWIKPEEAMMKLAWTETSLHGPSKQAITLPQPETNLDVYHDVAVLAFPTPPGELAAETMPRPKVTSNDPKCVGKHLIDNDPKTFAIIGRIEDQAWIQFEFAEPQTIRSVRFVRNRVCDMPRAATIQASDDGQSFRTIGHVRFYSHTTIPSYTIAIQDTTARYFRVVPTARCVFREVHLLENPRINYWQLKSGFGRHWGHGVSEIFFDSRQAGLDKKTKLTNPAWAAQPDRFAVDRDRICNLTKKMDADGRLDWNVPDGQWTVLRIGYTPTGEKNGPGSIEGTGLEPDALNPEGIDVAFENFLAKLIRDAGPLAGKTLKYGHIDSWETGQQNWTARFPEEFRKRRGYDLTTLLPVMTGGRIVGNLDLSERFLWDVRRTIADMLADYYYGRMREVCHRHGILFETEAAGAQQFLFDPITYQQQGDLPMGEFWVDEGRIRPDCKAAASVAHIFDKPFVGAESFTCGRDRARWSQYPYSLKALGDAAFAMGVNRFNFHRYAMQPWNNVRPGMTMGPWGIHLERTNTWWEPGSAWLRYLARCQSLLQQGQFVGDVLYFTGENVPHYLGQRHELNPPLPEGYDFDACNADILLNMVSVKDGQLVLPNDLKYRVLLLPDVRTMRPKLLEKIRDLVKAGAVVVGPRPEQAPGLTDYPQCDKQVRATADALWGSGTASDADKAGPIDRAVGRGHVFWGLSFEEIFACLNLPPDFQSRWYGGKSPNYIHRRNEQADWYFVANPSPMAVDATCTFRVAGKQPELWDPKTGSITQPAVYRQADGQTVVPIRFEPAGSLFVVFRDRDDGRSIHTVKRDGRVILSTENAPASKTDIAVSHDDSTISRREMVAGTKITAFAEHASSHQTGGLPTIEIAKNPSGKATAVVWEPGTYTFEGGNGEAAPVQVDVPKLPAPPAIEAPWNVSFPSRNGAPESLVFDKLISWTDDTRPSVKYFSGTATYQKAFEVPDTLLAKNRRLYLDLGEVQVIAQLTLNGKDLGVLWKPPFCVEVTDALKPGKNRLEIRVTNLWPNRLIGDEQFPPDCEYARRGNIAEWPDWFLTDKPRPEPRRQTFSSWKHYDKDSPLLKSGLLGPVTIRAAVTVDVPKGE